MLISRISYIVLSNVQPKVRKHPVTMKLRCLSNEPAGQAAADGGMGSCRAGDGGMCRRNDSLPTRRVVRVAGKERPVPPLPAPRGPRMPCTRRPRPRPPRRSDLPSPFFFLGLVLVVALRLLGVCLCVSFRCQSKNAGANLFLCLREHICFYFFFCDLFSGKAQRSSALPRTD